MAVIRVALLQLSAGAAVEENLLSGLAACREARANGADIAALLSEPATPIFDLEKLIH